MILLEVMGKPVPWISHGGYGNKSYSRRSKEKECFQWQIRSQWNRQVPISGPIRVDLIFHMPMPKMFTKAKRRDALNGILLPISRPDRTNLAKLYEDCLIGIVIEDDSQIVCGDVQKIYSETPKTVFKIISLNEHVYQSQAHYPSFV